MDRRRTSPDWRLSRCRAPRQLLLGVALVMLSLAGGPPAVAQERELGMAVIGNRELPKSLVIVPWKSPTLDQRSDRDLQSLISRSLQPLDPIDLRRRLRQASALPSVDGTR